MVARHPGAIRRPGGGRPSRGAVQTYPDTWSGYGPTRADSIGQAVSQYAYSSAQQDKAYNSKVPSLLQKVTDA